MLEIAPLNPIKFFSDLPYDFDHAVPKCYAQKWELADFTTLQLLSDLALITCRLKKFETNVTVLSYSVAKIDAAVANETFSVWETSIQFSGIEEGYYYLEVTGLDEFGDIDSVVYSAPLEVLEEHPGTMLFNYTNSYNDFNVLFDTNLIFNVRVEGTIQNFTPRADDEIYNDQKRNATKLSSIPYQTFILYVGNQYGLPDWMTDKINRVMSCDQIKIDGNWFEKIEGATWEVARIDDYPFSGIQIEIMPAVNHFLERLHFEDDNTNDMVLLRLANNHYNIDEDLTVSGIAKRYTMLDYISVIRRGATFTMNVGLTDGGNEIGTFAVDETENVFHVRYLFDGNATIYLTGIQGSNDISLVYDQIDETVTTSPTDPQPPSSLPQGACIMYHCTYEQLAQQFNIVSGDAKPEGNWVGWKLCNGQDGTYDMRRRMPVGWMDDITSRYGTPGTEGGAETVSLQVGNLPPHEHKIPRRRYSNMRGGGDITIHAPEWPDSGQVADNVVTEDGSGGDLPGGGARGLSFDIMNRYVVTVFVVKL